MVRQLVPLREGPNNGIPLDVTALEWISFHREFNGVEKAGAILKCGGRIYVDPQRFLDWMATGPRISPPVAKTAKPRLTLTVAKGTKSATKSKKQAARS